MGSRRMLDEWGRIGVAAGLLLFWTGAAVALDVRYVSDVLVVTMRAGKGDEHPMLRSLRSGTPVEVIEENGEFMKVKTREGEVGWVRKRYFISTPPVAAVNAGLEAEVERLKAELEKSRLQQGDPGNGRTDVRREPSETTAEMEEIIRGQKEEIQKLKIELEGAREEYRSLLSHSGQTADLVRQSKTAGDTIGRLEQENRQLSRRNGDLVKENQRLFRFGVIRWFVAGSIVLLAGLIMGRISRKKSYY